MHFVIRQIKSHSSLFSVGSIHATLRLANIAAAAVCWFLQIVLDPSMENILCATFSVIAIVVTSIYCFRESVFKKHMFSMISIYGLCLVATGFALFGMTVEWQSLIFNLRCPVLTFASSLALVLVGIAAHAVYAHVSIFPAMSNTIRDSIYKPLGLLRIPSDFELWVFGAIGVAAMLAAGTGEALYGANAVESGNVVAKFLQSLNVFAVAPYIIAFKRGLVSQKFGNTSPTVWLMLALYFVLMLGLAVARNQRATFAQIIMIICVCFLLMLLKGAIRVNGKMLLTVCAVAVIAIPAMGFLGNLSQAIRVVRGDRATLSTTALVSKTIDVMGQPALLKYAKDQENMITTGYSEVYFRSEMFTRFSMTKFTDNNWYSVGGFPDISPTLHDQAVTYAEYRTWSLLPTPVSAFFHIDVDKQSLAFNSSGGDFYVWFASLKTLGGEVTGSAIPDAYVLFGFFAPFFIFAMYIAYFIFMDSFLRFDAQGNVFALGFSVMMAGKIFQAMLLPEGFYYYFDFFLRAAPQLIIIYAVVTQATYMAFSWIAGPESSATAKS